MSLFSTARTRAHSLLGIALITAAALTVPAAALATAAPEGLLLRKDGTGEVLSLANGGGNAFSWDGSIRLNAFGAPSVWDPMSGDFDDDGDVDLMVRNHDTGDAAIAYNDGNGALSWNGQYTTGTAGVGYGAIWKPFVGDFGGANGADDYLLRNSDTGEVLVLINEGAGKFTWDGNIRLYAFGAPHVWDPMPGDYNGDGFDDLMVRNHDTGDAAIAYNDGHGGLSWNGQYVTGTPGVGYGAIWQPFVGNLAGGKADDFLLRNSSNGQVLVLRNDGSGAFSWDHNYWLNAFGAPSVWTPILGDFNGDRFQDLMVRNHDTGDAAIAYNDGSGGFSWNGQYTSGTAGVGYGAVWRHFVGVVKNYPTSHRYGGDDDSVNSEGEAGDVISAIRSGDDASASALRAGLTASDLQYVTARMDATAHSSLAYGGGNWKVDQDSEADRFITDFQGAPSDPAAVGLLSGLAPGDASLVDSRIARAGFVFGGLYRDATNGQVWETENGTKAWVTSSDAALQFGLNLSTGVRVTPGSIAGLAPADPITYSAADPSDDGGSIGQITQSSRSSTDTGPTYTCTGAGTIRNAGGKLAMGWCWNDMMISFSGHHDFSQNSTKASDGTTQKKFWQGAITGVFDQVGGGCGFIESDTTLTPNDSTYDARKCSSRGIRTDVFASKIYNGSDHQNHFVKSGKSCARYRNVDFTTAGRSPSTTELVQRSGGPQYLHDNDYVELRYLTKGGDYVMTRFPVAYDERPDATDPHPKGGNGGVDWAFMRADCFNLPTSWTTASKSISGRG
jgi:hypothetical protein